MGAGISPVPRTQDRAAPVAHLTLDRRPVFRSGLPALSSQTPWLAFPPFSCSPFFSFFHHIPRQGKLLPVKFITDVLTKSWVPRSGCCYLQLGR